MKKEKNNSFSSHINPILSQEKFHYKWIFAAIVLIMWSLLEEVVLSSSDLITNFFANQIKIGENNALFEFVKNANIKISGWTDYQNHKYSVGTIDVNALSAVTQIFIVISSVLFGFCYGIGVYTAQYFGAKKFQHLRDLVMFKIQLTVLISLIFVLFIELFSKDLIGFIIHAKSVDQPLETDTHAKWIAYYDYKSAKFSIDQGSIYIKIVCLSYPILAIQLALVTTLRETVRPMVSFWASFITLILTVIFLTFLVSPTFLGPRYHGFGLLGCAYSVILGKVVQIIGLVIFIYIQKYEFIPNRFWKLNNTILWTSFKKTIFITVNELFWSFSMLMQVKLLSIESLDALTANAILSTFVSILLVPAYHGISAAISVLVGNNLGNNKLKIAEINSKRLLWLTLFLGILLAGILNSFILLVSYIFSGSSQDVLSLSKKFILIYSIATPVLMINGTIYALIRAGGLAKTSFLMDSFYNWTITIPFMALLIYFTNLNIVAIFILVRVFEVSKLIPSLFFYFRKKWIKNLVYQL